MLEISKDCHLKWVVKCLYGQALTDNNFRKLFRKANKTPQTLPFIVWLAIQNRQQSNVISFILPSMLVFLWQLQNAFILMLRSNAALDVAVLNCCGRSPRLFSWNVDEMKGNHFPRLSISQSADILPFANVSLEEICSACFMKRLLLYT